MRVECVLERKDGLKARSSSSEIGVGGGVRRVLSEKHSVSEWLPVSIIVNNILVRSLNFL